jgi:hypothetical protein
MIALAPGKSAKSKPSKAKAMSGKEKKPTKTKDK